MIPICHATLPQPKIFNAMARHMSFACAAEMLLTPSALSIQVRQLTEAAGQPFFRTDPTGNLLIRPCEV